MKKIKAILVTVAGTGKRSKGDEKQGKRRVKGVLVLSTICSVFIEEILMRSFLYQSFSLCVFVVSMLSLFTGMLSIFPEPLFPADALVSYCRELVVFVLGIGTVPQYFGNVLAAFLMFTCCALLGDILDCFIRYRGCNHDNNTFENLVRILYSVK